MWHFCSIGASLCLVHCINGPPYDWETALSPTPISHIIWGLLGCFLWKLGHWFIDWASDRECTGEMSVCFHTRPSERCRGSMRNRDKVWDVTLTTQGVRQYTFVNPKVSHSPRKRRWMKWNGGRRMLTHSKKMQLTLCWVSSKVGGKWLESSFSIHETFSNGVI